jgi:macrolide transport system ATP-binding/permease protein
MSSQAVDASIPVLDLRKIGRTFGEEPAVHALIDVDLRVERGDWLAITGPSGAGKSTLLNLLGCLDHPTSGEYFVDGIDVSGLSDRQRAGLRSHPAALLPIAIAARSPRAFQEKSRWC